MYPSPNSFLNYITLTIVLCEKGNGIAIHFSPMERRVQYPEGSADAMTRLELSDQHGDRSIGGEESAFRNSSKRKRRLHAADHRRRRLLVLTKLLLLGRRDSDRVKVSPLSRRLSRLLICVSSRARTRRISAAKIFRKNPP